MMMAKGICSLARLFPRPQGEVAASQPASRPAGEQSCMLRVEQWAEVTASSPIKRSSEQGL